MVINPVTPDAAHTFITALAALTKRHKVALIGEQMALIGLGAEKWQYVATLFKERFYIDSGEEQEPPELGESPEPWTTRTIT